MSYKLIAEAKRGDFIIHKQCLYTFDLEEVGKTKLRLYKDHFVDLLANELIAGAEFHNYSAIATLLADDPCIGQRKVTLTISIQETNEAIQIDSILDSITMCLNV